MNIYVEQLEEIVKIIHGLNLLEKGLNGKVLLQQDIKLSSEHQEELGTLVDVIGGVWSFKPTPEKTNAQKEVT